MAKEPRTKLKGADLIKEFILSKKKKNFRDFVKKRKTKKK